MQHPNLVALQGTFIVSSPTSPDDSSSHPSLFSPEVLQEQNA